MYVEEDLTGLCKLAFLQVSRLPNEKSLYVTGRGKLKEFSFGMDVVVTTPLRLRGATFIGPSTHSNNIKYEYCLKVSEINRPETCIAACVENFSKEFISNELLFDRNYLLSIGKTYKICAKMTLHTIDNSIVTNEPVKIQVATPNLGQLPAYFANEENGKIFISSSEGSDESFLDQLIFNTHRIAFE